MDPKKRKWKVCKCRWWLDAHLQKYTGHRLIKTGKKYGGPILLSGEEGNEKLKRLIESGEPFACCRFGYKEEQRLIEYLEYCIKGGDPSVFTGKQLMWRLGDNDGGKGIRTFIQMFFDAAEEADILGVWSRVEMEDYLVSEIKGAEDKAVSLARMVEPYYFENPWSEALKGKKVLVINPFADLIQSQYEQHRGTLFENKKVLPEFELQTLQSVWVFRDPRFTYWTEAYDYLFDEAMKRDFDVALIGCGPLGFPLAARLKKAGKQAVHIGGALQIMFGIMGKRWEEKEFFTKMVNDSWTRPEKPDQGIMPERFDNACYW